jgi:hypothetical protein
VDGARCAGKHALIHVVQVIALVRLITGQPAGSRRIWVASLSGSLRATQFAPLDRSTVG